VQWIVDGCDLGEVYRDFNTESCPFRNCHLRRVLTFAPSLQRTNNIHTTTSSRPHCSKRVSKNPTIMAIQYIISKRLDPLFAISIGLAAAFTRINREEKEKGRSTQESIDVLKRRWSLAWQQGNEVENKA